MLEGEDMETAVTGDYLKLPAHDILKAGGPRLQTASIACDSAGNLIAVASERAAV